MKIFVTSLAVVVLLVGGVAYYLSGSSPAIPTGSGANQAAIRKDGSLLKPTVVAGQSGSPATDPSEGNAAPATAQPSDPRSATAAQIAQKIQTVLSKADDDQPGPLFVSMLPALVMCDPAGAALLAENTEPGLMREQLLHEVAQIWGSWDASSALTWAENLKDVSERDSALADVHSQAAPGNSADAPASPEGSSQQAPGIDRESTNLKDQYFVRAAFGVAQVDPATAASLVLSEIPQGTTQDEAGLSVIHQWAVRDLTAATAWVEQLPPGSLRERSKRELVAIAQYHQPEAEKARP